MQISHDYGLPIVKAFEGCLKPVPGRRGYFGPYYCPAGVLTQGWGHTNLGNIEPKVIEGVAWSQEQCDQALANDMVKFEHRVEKIMAGKLLDQNEFDALVSFDFNTGGLDRSSIPAKIKAGRRDQVAETLDRWNKANGQVLNGLVRRRKAEGLLFDGQKDEALRVAGAHKGTVLNTGEAMPQRVDRPKPPTSEVMKRAGAEVATATAGATGAVGGAATKPGTLQPDRPDAKHQHKLAGAAVVVGIVVMFVGVVLLIRKYTKIDADWA